MKKLLVISLFLFVFRAESQIKLCIDSSLKVAYTKKYGFSEGLMCMPFYCDPFCPQPYKKNDTLNLCGKFVFVNTDFVLKIKPFFELPCWFEPKFSEGLCAVSVYNQIVFIDTSGNIVFKTELQSCSPHRNRVLPFKGGKAKVYKGSGTLKNFYDVYYIDRKGNRIREQVVLNVRLKPLPEIIAKRDSAIAYQPVVVSPVFELPFKASKGKYPLENSEYLKVLANTPHRDNRMLLFFDCGPYQLENMSDEDTMYCGKFVFTDTFLNVKISEGFKLPCGFEPEFSEGLCAVSKDSFIVYIDTVGRVVINTGLRSCDTIINKASTFRNGIATLYIGDRYVRGLYTTLAINTKGERVRLLEFDDLELAEKKWEMFKNLKLEECANCFVGKGKTNGLWFLIEKSGKVRKKLDLK